MHGPFEESLRDLLRASVPQPDDNARLGWVLKTTNRQVGAGDLLSLMGHWLQAPIIGVNDSSLHLALISCIFVKDAFSADKIE